MAEKKKGTVELTTFKIGAAIYGMDILKVQEINKLMDMTVVPHAGTYIRGILNLRGQIVTVIDLACKLGLPPTRLTAASRNIILISKDEYFGLLVDGIGDVVRTDWENVEAAPANLGGVLGGFFEGVVKTDRHLIGILNTDEVLRVEE